MTSQTTKCRPIITSHTFSNQKVYIPFRYDFSIEEIQEIKKYLPKNLFKLHGVDVEKEALTNQENEMLQKSKLKVKAVEGKWVDNKQPVEYLPKQQVRIVEWYNKSITLSIPYSSKSSAQAVQQLCQSYLDYYLQNFMLFKNTLTEELYTQSQQNQTKLTVEQLATETDVVFVEWSIEAEHTEDQVQMIRVNVPVLLCLNINETYQLKSIRQTIKTDILSSLSIMLKHQFNTRVLLPGSKTKEFICLNSYCNEQNALKQQQKLKTILGLQQPQTVETQQTKSIAKKDHKLLILILSVLVVMYFVLKIFPIHGRDENMYIKQQKPFQQTNFTADDQQLF